MNSALCFAKELIYHCNTLCVFFCALADLEKLEDKKKKQNEIENATICALGCWSIPLAFFSEKVKFKDRNHLAFRYVYHLYLRLLTKLIFMICDEDINKCCQILRENINGQTSIATYISRQKDAELKIPFMFSSGESHSSYYSNEIIGLVINNAFSRHDYYAYREETISAEQIEFEFDPRNIVTGRTTLEMRPGIKVKVVRKESGMN